MNPAITFTVLSSASVSIVTEWVRYHATILAINSITDSIAILRCMRIDKFNKSQNSKVKIQKRIVSLYLLANNLFPGFLTTGANI